jgi:CheY-like chemotaxis protein
MWNPRSRADRRGLQASRYCLASDHDKTVGMCAIPRTPQGPGVTSARNLDAQGGRHADRAPTPPATCPRAGGKSHPCVGTSRPVLGARPVNPKSINLPPVLRSRTILVIEDDVDTRDAMRVLLEAHGAVIIVAGNDAEGFTQLTRTIPDAILCDLTMPGMDGVEFGRRLREQPRGTVASCCLLLPGEAGWTILRRRGAWASMVI